MTAQSPTPVALETMTPIAIAVMAMGGQGGGVLADWIVCLCEAQRWAAQSTSVPGVAQRTGATIYYIETLPLPANAPPSLRPIFSLMAGTGDVDAVIGAEWMEAGRAIQRGLVTPERTILIASTHRDFAVAEKQVPGDGIANSETIAAAAEASAKRVIAFDMAKAAEEVGSALSAVLFGALAAADILPFPPEAYEATIRAVGLGVEASLRGFAIGYQRAKQPREPTAVARSSTPILRAIGDKGYDALVARARNELPSAAHDMIAAGLQRVVDFQDLAYGTEYLDLLTGIVALDAAANGASRDFLLTRTAAKYIAVAMAYDDVYRVADLKTRGSRFDRLRKEIAAGSDQLVYTTEFMHPRMEEVADSLPAALGHYIEARPSLFKALDRVVNRGRRVKTSQLTGFVMLYVLGGLKRFRRTTLRHRNEVKHRDAWLARVRTAAPKNYAFAVELLACRRLVKGYSDTHARGMSKFDRVMAAATLLEGRSDAADWVRRLREAALKDEEGIGLNGAIKTIESFCSEGTPSPDVLGMEVC
jgi:indolepyruvate ferredoxin oxidoreductase, beta subunit